MIILTTHIHTYTSSFNRAFLMRSVVSVWFQLIKFSIGRSEWGKRTQQQPFHARKMHHFAKTGSGQTERKTFLFKKKFFRTRKPMNEGSSRKTFEPAGKRRRKSGLFLEFSLCLSRACLGKMMHYVYKWRKKWRFYSPGCAAAVVLCAPRVMPL